MMSRRAAVSARPRPWTLGGPRARREALRERVGEQRGHRQGQRVRDSASPGARSGASARRVRDDIRGRRVDPDRRGQYVRTASTGRQAIEQTLAEPPDVALVDIGLPDIDGCEVGRTMRDQPGGRGVYLVALTGHGTPEDRLRAL